MTATLASTDLAPEIWATIIRAASTTLRVPRHGDPDDQCAVDYGRLCSLGLVSKDWQKLIKASPFLWMPISPLLPLHGLNVVLSRTGSAPLVVAQSRGSQTGTPLANAKKLLAELGRMKSFRMVLSAATWSEVASLLHKEAPLLQTFEIQVGGATVTRTISPLIFQGARPPLMRRLLLKGIMLPWNSPILSGLVSLHLDLSNFQRRPTSTEFAGFLQQLQSLKSLRLVKALPELPDDIENVEDTEVTARLPALRYLHVEDEQPDRSAAFFLSTEMKLSKVDIVYQAEESNTVEVEFIPTLLQGCISRLAEPKAGKCLVVKNGYLRNDWSFMVTFAILSSSGEEILATSVEYFHRAEFEEEVLEEVADTLLGSLAPELVNVNVLKFEHSYQCLWQWGWLSGWSSSIPKLRRVEVAHSEGMDEEDQEDFFSELTHSVFNDWTVEAPRVLVRA